MTAKKSKKSPPKIIAKKEEVFEISEENIDKRGVELPFMSRNWEALGGKSPIIGSKEDSLPAPPTIEENTFLSDLEEITSLTEVTGENKIENTKDFSFEDVKLSIRKPKLDKK